MPRREKLRLSGLLEALPKLLRFAKRGKGKQRSNSLKELTGPERDAISKLAEIFFDTVPASSLTSRQLARINTDHESLSFLRGYSKCSRQKKSCIKQSRDTYLSQSGRGLKTVLDFALPVLTDVIKEILFKRKRSSASSPARRSRSRQKKVIVRRRYV